MGKDRSRTVRMFGLKQQIFGFRAVFIVVILLLLVFFLAILIVY